MVPLSQGSPAFNCSWESGRNLTMNSAFYKVLPLYSTELTCTLQRHPIARTVSSCKTQTLSLLSKASLYPYHTPTTSPHQALANTI